MKLSLKCKRAKKDLRQLLTQHVFAIAPVHKLIKNRRAINAVISNVILIGAVIVVGFAALSWSQYQSSAYQSQYTSDVNANIGQLQEKIVFEYVVKVDGNLTVYLLNYGTQNVTIKEVSVNGQRNSTAISLHPLGAETSTVPSLNVDAQAFFTVPASGSSPYLVKIVTGRGSTFVGSS